MQLITQFLTDVAHDLRRPIRTLRRRAFPFSAAAFFYPLWIGLNAKAKYLGEGFDGYGSGLMASTCFFFWANKAASDAEKNVAEGEVPNATERILIKLAATCFMIPVGRIAFTILPPWHNAIGAVIAPWIAGPFIEPLLSKGRGRFKFHRGTVEITAGAAHAQIDSMPAGTEPQIEWAGFKGPGEIAEGNIAVIGTIGSGKTRMHREIIKSQAVHFTRGSDRRGVLYDVKSDAVAELESMNLPCGLKVFDPYDIRSWAWDVAADIVSSSDATNFAQALIPDPGGNDKKYFADAARNITSAVIERLNELLPACWTLRDLILILSSEARMKTFLAGSDVLTEYFNDTDAFKDTMSTIANTMRTLRPVAACWEHTRKFSLKKWLVDEESILVLAGKPGEVALQVINRVICKILSAELLKGEESPRKSRFWFFCDELKDAGQLDSLSDFVNGRSKGIRCVLGLQDLEGAISQFGDKEKVYSILNNCSTISWLKLASTDTAAWAGKRVGEFEQFEYLEVTSKDGTSISEHLTKREAMLESQFLQMEDYRDGVVTGIHIFKFVAGVFKSKARYEHPNCDASRNFLPRDISERELAPWTDADAMRLSIGDQCRPTTEITRVPKGGVALGDINRIEFH